MAESLFYTSNFLLMRKLPDAFGIVIINVAIKKWLNQNKNVKCTVYIVHVMPFRDNVEKQL